MAFANMATFASMAKSRGDRMPFADNARWTIVMRDVY
jgi:hypothetical protein